MFKRMNKYTLTTLSVSGGVLSGLAWREWCPGLILLCSFVPFFLIGNYLYKNQERYSPNAVFLYFLPGFVIFALITLGWIRVISLTAAVCMILTAAFLMAFTMWLSHRIRLREGNVQGYLSLIALWLTLEFVCLRIPVLSPWINLGNGLAKDIRFIQWYEVTGTAGGTLWILLSNLFLAELLAHSAVKNSKKRMYLSLWLIIVLVPSVFSVIRYNTIESSPGPGDEAVIVQPNFDPYEEKFMIPFEEQLRKVLDMAKPFISSSTDWLVTPETTVYDPVDETTLNDNNYIRMIRDYISERPHLSVVTGMVTFTSSAGSVRPGISSDAREYYNSSLKIDSGKVPEVYHKSKLVPGFEFIPSSGFFGVLSRLLPELGGMNLGYSTQETRTCFENRDKSRKIAPLICYESAFGEYVTDFIREGAGAIFIITNDGWWKNTIGYQQHLSFSSIRAIETRRPVIRSANTGISCFIDIRGKITNKSEWWVPSVIKGNFVYEDRLTPYVRFGDYLMYMACVISILTLLVVFVFNPYRSKLK
jgi:apolipoprotein N-acyltransferase